MSRVIKFILGLLILHVLFLTVNFFIEKNYRSVNQERDDEFLSEGFTKEIVFLGNSRLARAVDFAQLPCVFNYTSGGESIWCYYYRLKYILENEPNVIRQVVIPAEVGQFYFSDSKLFLEADYWDKYVDYSELATLTGEKRKYYSLQAKTLLVPYANTLEYSTLSSDIKRRKDQKLEFSFEDKSFSEFSQKEQSQLQKSALNYIRDNTNDYTLGIVYLIKLIDLCKEHNVDITFVKLPITQGLKHKLMQLSKSNNVPNTDSIIQLNNCQLIDLSGLFVEDEKYFYDAHHMNSQGSEIITAKFQEFLTCEN